MQAGEALGHVEFAVLGAVQRGALRACASARRIPILGEQPDGEAILHAVLRYCEREGLLHGTRDASGKWTTEQAHKVLAYTKSVGGHIAATEFMNEPNLPSFGGAPKGYDAVAYARDLAIFKPFLKQSSPDTLLIGPGSTSEDPHSTATPIPGMLTTPTLLTATGPAFDVFDFHLYPTISQRCAQMIPGGGTKVADALSAAWLTRSEEITSFYDEIKFFPSVKYFPGVIGGHCVMPNIKMLYKSYPSHLLEAIEASNELKIEREATRNVPQAV